MEKIIYIFLFTLFIISCKAQKIIELKSKDVLVFEFDKNVKLAKFYSKVYNKNNKFKKYVEASENKKIHSMQNFIIIAQDWKGYGTHYFDKAYLFILKKDTMNIKCGCGQGQNYYFRDLIFQKGNYELSYKKPKEKILGKEIKIPTEVQNILFTNTYVSPKEPVFQDVYFKNIEFYEIDLKDTINVKLEKIKALLE